MIEQLDQIKARIEKIKELQELIKNDASELNYAKEKCVKLRKSRNFSVAETVDNSLKVHNNNIKILETRLKANKKLLRNEADGIDNVIIDLASQYKKDEGVIKDLDGLIKLLYDEESFLDIPELNSVCDNDLIVTHVVYTDNKKDDGKIAYVEKCGIEKTNAVKPQVYAFKFSQTQQKGKIIKVKNYSVSTNRKFNVKRYFKKLLSFRKVLFGVTLVLVALAIFVFVTSI